MLCVWSAPPIVDNDLSNINRWQDVHEEDEAALQIPIPFFRQTEKARELCKLYAIGAHDISYERDARRYHFHFSGMYFAVVLNEECPNCCYR